MGSLEDRLILACLRIDPNTASIRSIVDRGPDWQVFLEKTEALGLAPLLHSSIKLMAPSVEIPKPVRESLRHLHNRETIASLTLRETLRPVLGRFHASRIPVVVLKGVALAALIYPSPALRPMADIDLLVHRDDLRVADVLLREAGFERQIPDVSDSRIWSDPPIAIGYARPQRYPSIKLQRHIVSDTELLVRIPIEDLWKRSRPAEVESTPTLSLSTEDLLLHLGIHLAKRHGFFGQARSVRDIAEVCLRYQSAIEWSSFSSQAATYNVSKYLYYSLRLARDLVGAEVPHGVFRGLSNFCSLPVEKRFVTAVASAAILSVGRRADSQRLIFRIGAACREADSSRGKIASITSIVAESCRERIRGLVKSLGKVRQRCSPFDKASEAIQSAASGPEVGLVSTDVRSSFAYSADGARDAELAVTYDQSQTDGLGAQLQRIYSIYALSRALHIKYIHTPIGRVGYQGLLPLLQGRTNADFADKYNAFFMLPSDDFDLEGCRRIKVENLTEHSVEKYRQLAVASGRLLLLQTPLAYGYTDRCPESYLTLREVSPYRNFRASGALRICIHLRRGDNVFTRQDQRFRLLPNSYYLRVCHRVIDILNAQGVPFVVRMHTEMPPRPYTIHPGIQGLYFDLRQPSTIDPNEFGLEEFDELPNLEIVLNAEPQAALNDFATADVLVLSLSSFGYLAGLLNTHGLVVYAPWWHKPLPDWLVATEEGHLEMAPLAVRIAEQIHRRGQREF